MTMKNPPRPLSRAKTGLAVGFLTLILCSAIIVAGKLGRFEKDSGVKQNTSKAKTSAVSALSGDQADQTNGFALLGKKIQNTNVTIVEGKLSERSELPDPAQSEYPDCRYTAHFFGNSILSGEPCPRELNLIIEGFSGYTALPSNDLKKGDKIRCTIIPFDNLKEEHKTTQQADDLSLYSLESYYVLDVRTVDSFVDYGPFPPSGILFSDSSYRSMPHDTSIYDRKINPPLSPEIVEEQKASIREDLKKMNDLLGLYDENRIRSINHAFEEAWQQEYENDAEGRNRIGNIVWRNMDGSFWALPLDYTFLSEPDTLSRKTLDSFIALRDFFESNGVQLIVSLVPDLYVISSRVINRAFRDIPDLQTATYVKQLSEAGIETVYPSDAIIADYNRFPFAYWFPENNHPADTTQDVISDILANRLKRYDIAPCLSSSMFQVNDSPCEGADAVKALFPENCDIGGYEAKSVYLCKFITYDGKPVPRTEDAPILICGNSFVRTPMGEPESLLCLLSMKTLSTVDCMRLDGRGPLTTLIARIPLNPDRFLKGRKVCIFQFGTNALTEVNQKGNICNIRDIDQVLLNQ